MMQISSPLTPHIALGVVMAEMDNKIICDWEAQFLFSFLSDNPSYLSIFFLFFLITQLSLVSIWDFIN